MKTIAVSILCGGKSSRMQSEKGLALYQGIPFIEHIIKAVLPFATEIQLITNTTDYDYLEYKKIKDIELDKGPIGGIYSALTHSSSELNLIVSCDVPLISTELLLELLEKHQENATVTVFADRERIHPLIGIYCKKVLPILKDAIVNSNLRMMEMIHNVDAQIIKVGDDKSNQFRNINTIAELNELNTNLS
ncbi:molybdenum cofactor guanylyltransferase [Flavobacterium sp. WC2430]|uniref:molybdenum cofactor guanylyltransferase n=1 Tax=Flavobacterium sp. WC2430 TaxID=3234137 RepID=UPI003465514E